MNDKHLVVNNSMIIETIPGEEEFKILLILAEIGMAMGHGSNSSTIYLLFTSNLGYSSFGLTVLKVLCAFSMALGVYFSGSKIIKIIGIRFVTYSNTCAFSSQFSAMATTLISSVIGYPVSTSQAYIFSLLGLKWFFTNPEVITMEKSLRNKIIILWILLPFVCVLMPILMSGVYFFFKWIINS